MKENEIYKSSYTCILCKTDSTISSDTKDDICIITCQTCGTYKVSNKQLRLKYIAPIPESELEKLREGVKKDPDFILKNL